MTRLGRAVLASALIALSASPAYALDCSVSSAGVAFGSYDTLAATPLDGAGSISVSCLLPTSFTVALSSGSGSIQQRVMTAGASQLVYNLYTDATRTVIWGDGVSGSTVSGTGTSVDLPIHGRIPAGQNVAAGLYSDTITITVSY